MELKKLSFCFIAALFTLSSCSSDDNNESNSIVGTWTYSPEDVTTEVETSNATFTDVFKIFLKDQYRFEIPYTAVFKADNTYTIDYDIDYQDMEFKEAGTYSFKNGIFTKANGVYHVTAPNSTIVSGNTMTFRTDLRSECLNADGSVRESIIHDLFDIEYRTRLAGVDRNTVTITKINSIEVWKRK